MQIELNLSAKGFFEIWTDNQFVKEIPRAKGENEAAYEARAEKEYQNYVSRLKAIKQGSGGAKTVKRTVL